MQQIVIVLALLWFLAGCGLKGDLYLPDDNSEQNQQEQLKKVKKKQ